MNTLKKICIVISISAFVNALIAIVDFMRVIEYQTGEGYIKFIVNIVFYLGIGIGGIAGNGAIQTSVPSNENNIKKSNDKVGFENLNQYFPTNNEKKMKTTVNNVTTKGCIPLLMLLLLVPMLAMAQEYPSKDKLIPVDEMRLKVQYNVDFHYSKEKPDKVKHDVMYTEIGNKMCHSYIEREWKNEVKFNRNYENDGKRGTNAFFALYSNIGEVFVGYPKGKNTVIYSLDVLGAFKYEEPTAKLKWTITEEKLDTLDYHCTMAVCKYAGREYRAWFTEEIPVSYGPWKLCGLPGLIIKAETVDGEYRFVLGGIETVKTPADISLWKRDFISTSKKKVRKQEKLLLSRPDAVLDQMGIGYGAVSYDGSKPKFKFFTYDNPLEID